MKIILTGPDYICECCINPFTGRCWKTDKPPFEHWPPEQIKAYGHKRGWNVEVMNGWMV